MKKSAKNYTIIKFVGLPGVGKTSITRKLNFELQKRGYETACWEEKDSGMVNYFLNYGRIQRYFLILWHLLKGKSSLKTFFRGVFLFIRLNPWKLGIDGTKKYMNSLRVFLVRNFLMQKQEAEVYIIDEAMLNSISHIKADIINNKFKELMNIFIPNGVQIIIVFAEAPIEVVIKRIISRERVRFRGRVDLSKKDLKKMKKNQDKNIKKIKEAINDVENIFSTKVNTTDSLDKNVKHLVSLFEGINNK
jgi:GTPase SAR1 family protein